MNFSSKYIEQAVDQLSSLPGIGKRTALRLALNLLKRDPEEVKKFTQSIVNLKEHVNSCSICHNISDQKICSICSNQKRDSSLICVVEDMRDVLAIENTQQYNGLYHVLGGVISPMDGIGPSNLTIDTLIDRAEKDSVKEIILALSTTMEGDTTNFYIYRKLENKNLNISLISRGIGVGNQLEYIDELTLGKSIVNRSPYEINFTS